MKRIVLLIASAMLVLACEKYMSNDPGSSGIYMDGKRLVPIGSVFIGGGIADPAKGASHRCRMYEEYFSTGPRWDEVPSIVTMFGFRVAGASYSGPGQYLNHIIINNAVLNTDRPLIITLQQGEYKGGNEQVASVRIRNYDFGTVNDNGRRNGDGKIDIVISLTDGRTLRLHYRGTMPYDGYV